MFFFYLKWVWKQFEKWNVPSAQHFLIDFETPSCLTTEMVIQITIKCFYTAFSTSRTRLVYNHIFQIHGRDLKMRSSWWSKRKIKLRRIFFSSSRKVRTSTHGNTHLKVNWLDPANLTHLHAFLKCSGIVVDLMIRGAHVKQKCLDEEI